MLVRLCVHLLRVDDGLHDLLAEGEGEVAVLQQEPVALGDGERHVLSRSLLLTLAHGQLQTRGERGEVCGDDYK